MCFGGFRIPKHVKKPRASARGASLWGRSMSNETKELKEFTFMDFVSSLAANAMIHLGEKHPDSKEPVVDLPLAKSAIDLIKLLKDKTKGNLTLEEEKFIFEVIYHLEMKFVDVTREKK
jgi:hypothetical protein